LTGRTASDSYLVHQNIEENRLLGWKWENRLPGKPVPPALQVIEWLECIRSLDSCYKSTK